MSSAYPTLSLRPSRPLTIVDDDNVIRSDKAAGYTHKRPRYSRIRKTFMLQYPALPLGDLYHLLAFYNSMNANPGGSVTQFFFYSFDEAYDPILAWKSGTAYLVGDIIHPTASTGHSYICTVAGTSGATPPTWPTTENTTVGDGAGSLIWMENAYTCTFGGPIDRKSSDINRATVQVTLEQV